MFTKCFTCNTKQKTDREASQDNKERQSREKLSKKLSQRSFKLKKLSWRRARAREELGAWKVEIN